jgi:hypothetical protein
VTLRRVLVFFTCLLFVEETPQCIYATTWISPFGWAHDFFWLKPPYQARPYDHILLVCLLLGLRKADGKGPRVAPMKSTLLLSLATLVIWFAYGMARGGGDFRFGCWQIYIPLSAVLYAFTIAAVFKTPEHYAMLAKALLVAAAYRAIMCLAYYFLMIRTGRLRIQDYMTTHDDSVLWVVAILILVLRLLRTKSFFERIGVLLFLALLLAAVQYNTRRLAWVSLVMGLVVFFVLLPPGKAKRSAVRAVSIIVPVVGLYAAIGWGRPESIFKPLAAFSSITTTEDESTKSRNVENLGLISTTKANGWLIGGGWGHQYDPISFKYDLHKVFELWRYIPHNSILGILAFTGVLGYAGYMMAYPTAMFLNARMARMGSTQLARDLGLIGAVQMVVVVNQYFGDMGLFSYKVVYTLATSYAIALRSPILCGVWPAGKVSVPRRPAQQRSAQASQPASHEMPSQEQTWQS